MTLLDEIREQPDAAARFLDRQLPAVRSIAKSIRRRRPDFVVVAARGTSDHAAIYAQYALGLRNRLPIALAAPSMYSLYRSGPALARSVVLAISQSGESPDVVAVVDEARRQGAPTIAITNEAGSALAAAADHVVLLEAEVEAAVAATKTYTTQLLAVAALSEAIAADGHREEHDLRRVPEALGGALDTESAARASAEGVGESTRMIVLGRGYEYATALEWALKLQELTYVMAHAWSSADFAHGPRALIERGLPILAVIPDDVAGDDLASLLGGLRDAERGPLVVISDRPDAARLLPIRTGGDLAPWLAPIVSIVPGQLFAYHLARARGLDAEQPRSITKVTRTR